MKKYYLKDQVITVTVELKETTYYVYAMYEVKINQTIMDAGRTNSSNAQETIDAFTKEMKKDIKAVIAMEEANFELSEYQTSIFEALKARGN